MDSNGKRQADIELNEKEDRGIRPQALCFTPLTLVGKGRSPIDTSSEPFSILEVSSSSSMS